MTNIWGESRGVPVEQLCILSFLGVGLLASGDTSGPSGSEEER